MSAPDEPQPTSPRATANGYRSQTYYLSTDLHERLKAAWWATRAEKDGDPSLSSLMGRLLSAECNRLEAELNDGKPFTPAPKKARGSRSTHASGHRSHTYYLNSVLHEEFKAAWWATRTEPSLSMLVAVLMETEARRLEKKFNDGQQFPRAPIAARGVDPAGARRQGDFMANMWSGTRQENEK